MFSGTSSQLALTNVDELRIDFDKILCVCVCFHSWLDCNRSHRKVHFELVKCENNVEQARARVVKVRPIVYQMSLVF